MEDLAPPSEASTRRPKRTRAQAHTTENQTSEANLHVDRESSPEDFEEARPKSKRNRGYDGASASAHKATDLSLIEVIKGNGKLIPQVIKLWVERYEKGPKTAMVELLMMLFEACGAKYHIQEEFLDETDVDDVVVALVNLSRTGEVEDYQNSKRKEFKNFKDNLESFWDNLVRECQHGPLFDQVLFDKCMDYIIALSCTPPRVYRQVASMMGLRLVTSFIAVAKMLGAQRETTRRQLDAEKKKRTEGPRLESLNKRFSTTHEQITVLEEMMRKIFTGICTLKYLGWTLNDKNAGVRRASILALQNLYEVDDNVPTLSLFSERFSNRMIELADDIDVSVAVCAIGLVKQLLRHQLIPDDDLGPLYDLLIDDPPEIRHAIGALVYDHLIAQKFNTSQSGTKGDGSTSSEVYLGRMLQILREFSTDPILSIYVIDDVWEYMKAMKDWKCIISMLLDENPLIELTDDDATNLVRLLCSSVRKAVGERIVPATDNRKQYYTKAQKEVFENNRRDITVAMMKNYPLLLRKFMADKGKVSSLVEIVLHTNLELYSLKRQEQSFKSVLQLMKEAFFKHGEKEALRSCVRAINFCSTESQGELQDFARNELKELEDELIAKLKAAIKEVVVVIFLLLNMYLDLAWCLQPIVTSETVTEASLSLLLSKRNTFFEQLDYFLDNFSEVEEVDETEDEDVNKDYIEEINRDAVMIAAAKMVIIDAVPKEFLGPEIISHFVMHGNGVAEIVKNLITVLKKKDDDLSIIFLEALKRVRLMTAYHRHMVELSKSEEEPLTSKSFVECKDLATRLSGTFTGAARNKHRSDILKIVKDGIDYAFVDAPKQLSFLEGAVLDFVSKLPTPDVLDIVKDVQKRTENVNTDEDPSGWRPYYTFVDSLREKYAKNEGFQDEKEGVSVRRRGRPRKQRNIEGKRLFDEHNSSEEEDSISASDREDAQDEEEKQDEEEEEDAPLIRSIRSSKLRSLRLSREENKGQTRTGDSGRATDNLAASRTSGASS
uniref:SCD domain-containing protein n=1 Tax=Fagus sylvatica TaxID=28930 RepID=A0A2N9GJR5_FAGSY